MLAWKFNVAVTKQGADEALCKTVSLSCLQLHSQSSLNLLKWNKE